MGTDDELKSLLASWSVTEREEALFFDGFEQHGLLVRPSSPISSRKSKPPSAERSRPDLSRGRR